MVYSRLPAEVWLLLLSNEVIGEFLMVRGTEVVHFPPSSLTSVMVDGRLCILWVGGETTSYYFYCMGIMTCWNRLCMLVTGVSIEVVLC